MSETVYTRLKCKLFPQRKVVQGLLFCGDSLAIVGIRFCTLMTEEVLCEEGSYHLFGVKEVDDQFCVIDIAFCFS